MNSRKKKTVRWFSRRWLLDIDFPLLPQESCGKCCRLGLFSLLFRPDRLTGQALPAASSRPSNPVFTRSLQSRRILPPVGSLACSAEPEMAWHRAGEISTQRTALTNHVSSNPAIAWKASLTCRPKTDLHVRPEFSDRADQKSRGRRDVIRNTRGGAARNGIDFSSRAH